MERLENLQASLFCLLRHFNTNITVWESSYRYNGFLKGLLNPNINYKFIQDDDPILFRTQYINRMLAEVKTPFVSVWDTDVIAPFQQLYDSIMLLRTGQGDFVYPYEKLFLDTTPIIRNIFLNKKNDMNVLINNQKLMQVMYPPDPVGGAFFANIASYRKSGLENEDLYGWGVEDGERCTRWKRKGFCVERIKGPLFHLSHPRGINSLLHHPDQSIIKRRLINYTYNLLQEKH
jgi:hypothetical protein